MSRGLHKPFVLCIRHLIGVDIVTGKINLVLGMLIQEERLYQAILLLFTGSVCFIAAHDKWPS